MVSEILQELEDNANQMRNLIDLQKFSVGDAGKFLSRYFNIVRKMEDLETSNDSLRLRLKNVDEKWKLRVEKADLVWRERHDKLKVKHKKLKEETER